ncbi:Rieske (2Fe-2S) protein [Kribbella sindirgiensis]|uniref:Cytochrome bc1 complex Rieske iron-sulfur subunit n=1 Tax=Kribbella sindirgiensis TaxID=1124744 RepID=A0A4R0IR89_9ACTN|nr:Rieske (2Fe-2S) protein [Kribbella sindirgiensis]TCC34914.1 Rieske (2Fe-2S) protein [Kribbella sindirgiensis]
MMTHGRSLDRRAVLLTGSLAVGAALTGCVVEQPASSPAAPPPASTGSGNGQQPEPTERPQGGGVKPLAVVNDIAPQGGVVVKDEKVVVTRDAEGTPHAFSAVCTHRGCLVASVEQGTINCPCHGSKFDIATGAPVGGPAKSPLAPVSVELRDGSIFRA